MSHHHNQFSGQPTNTAGIDHGDDTSENISLASTEYSEHQHNRHTEVNPITHPVKESSDSSQHQQHQQQQHQNQLQHQFENPLGDENDDNDGKATPYNPPTPILGPLADLERSITSFESLQHRDLSHFQTARTTQTNQTNKSNKTNQTNASSKTLRVKRLERRGLLSQLVVIPEYYDARDYPLKIKYFIVGIIALASITGPMGTSIMLPAIDDIVDKLDTTVSMVNVSVGIYLLSLGIFPLWWSSFSERFGRRSVYFISFVLFVAFSIGTSLSPNISALIVLRVLQGGSSASVQAVGAGTIADLFVPQERGKAMGWYYLGPLMGPFLAPILGGAVSQAWGWRATQWLLMIFAACNLISITFFLPETLRKLDNLALLKNIMKQAQKAEPIDEKEKTEENVQQNEKEKLENSDDSSFQGEEMLPTRQQQQQQQQHQQHNKNQTKGHQDPHILTDNQDQDLQRVATNMSRRSSARSVRSIIEDDEDEGPIMDPVMPTLSRLTTNRSSYSRKLQQSYVAGEIRRSMSNMGVATEELPREENGIGATNTSTLLTQPPSLNKRAEFKRNCYDLIIRPLHSLVLLKHPPVVLVILYSGISFAVIYFFNMTISYEYAREPYKFSQIIVGLMYIPNSVTYLAASMIGGRWNDHLLNKYAEKHGELVPESRISWNIVLAVILYPMACLIFGWTIKYGEFWLVPLIGTAICGFASMLVIGATVTYLVDTLPGKGATGVALNNLIRQILAAVATFIVEPLLVAIGPGILFSILMGILTVASLILLYLKRKGAYFREHYDLMKLYDKL